MPEVKYLISTGILPAIWLLMFHCRASLRPAGKVVSTRSTLSCWSRMRNSMRGRVDERVGPGELDAVDAFLDREQAVLADHGDVFGVVDRKLRALAGGQGHQIDGGPGRGGKDHDGYQQRPIHTDLHIETPLLELQSMVIRAGGFGHHTPRWTNGGPRWFQQIAETARGPFDPAGWTATIDGH